MQYAAVIEGSNGAVRYDIVYAPNLSDAYRAGESRLNVDERMRGVLDANCIVSPDCKAEYHAVRCPIVTDGAGS